MRINVKMPRMGQSMEEGTIAAWLVKVGDCVKKEQPLAELETDKAVVSLESPVDGEVVAILIPINKVVLVGIDLAVIEDGKSDVERPRDINTGLENQIVDSKSIQKDLKKEPIQKISLAEKQNRVSASPAAREFAKKVGIDLLEIREVDPRGFITLANVKEYILFKQAQKSHGEKFDFRINASPIAKRFAEDLNIDLSKVTATGEGGRVTREDVEKFHSKSESSGGKADNENIAVIHPLSKLKKTVAQRMSDSKETIPHFYVTIEVDMTSALVVRETMKRKGKEISINDLVIRAAAYNLVRFPNLNAMFIENSIHQYHHVDMAVAIASSSGLITPVISRCELLSLHEVASATRALISRTREGKLAAEDLKMGTFTITNLGMFGVHDFVAIINPPQVAILAVGAVKKAPIYSKTGQLIPAELMNLTLSVDHRAVDGAEASQFLRDLKLNLEEGFQTGNLN